MDEMGYDPIAPARAFTSAWIQSSSELSKGVTRFWRNAAANSGFSSDEDDETEETEPTETRVEPNEPTMAYNTEEWTVERTVERREDLGVGDVVRFSKVLSDDDVHSFATASGDTNRLHLDDEFAAETRFGHRIAHGTLVSGTISAALARLPGLTIYLSQDLRFLKPVDIGDRVTAVCEVVESLGDERYRLTTRVERSDGEVVIDGEAVVLIDDGPEAAA